MKDKILVKSKFSFGLYAGATISISWLLFDVYWLGYTIAKFDSKKLEQSLIFLAIMLFGTIIFSIVSILILSFFNRIEITEDSISFTNIFTNKKTLYEFQELDGYYETVDYITYFGPEVNIILELIKDGKKVKNIVGKHYSNIDSIIGNLRIEYMIKENIGFLDKMKRWIRRIKPR